MAMVSVAILVKVVLHASRIYRTGVGLLCGKRKHGDLSVCSALPDWSCCVHRKWGGLTVFCPAPHRAGQLYFPR